MSVIQANCPACGAPISFKVGSSIVVVCEFCRSVVARTDRALEDLGKVAEIAETGSPLDIGLKGVYHGVPFELTGRTQLGHEAGGMWDEWYAAFGDGRWGWLAEAQGRFYLTFEQSPLNNVPSFDALELGHPVAAIPVSSPLVVAEKGVARTVGAKGEIPWRVVPGATYPYADLSGQGHVFATLDYSEATPLVFIGQEVTLAQLGITTAHAPEREQRCTAAAQLSCPKCGGPLELRAPDKTERVTCPNCSSLLDVNYGQLRFLSALEPGKYRPVIPAGATGELQGVKLTVLGFVVRSVVLEGETYYWEEYLLYNPQVGFRWLVRSDDHWNIVQPVSPGEVTEDFRKARYHGKDYKLFQDATATVQYVTGEFYWKVTVGEQVRALDYIRPPEMLSIEISTILPHKAYLTAGKDAINWDYGGGHNKAGSGEINCSLGTYLTPSMVEKAFGISGLPRPKGVAPNQPFPSAGIAKYWVIFTTALLLLGLAFLVTGSNRKVYEQGLQLSPVMNPEATQTFFSEPFQLEGSRNIKITGYSNVYNTWVYADGDLINQDTGLVQPFALPIEYYAGVEGGESWSEGSRTQTVYLSALPAGTYTLRLESQWEKWQQPASLSVKIEQGVPRMSHLLLALTAVSIFPLIHGFRRIRFETKRWQDSMYRPTSRSG